MLSRLSNEGRDLGIGLKLSTESLRAVVVEAKEVIEAIEDCWL
jgi:hypothetical protein